MKSEAKTPSKLEITNRAERRSQNRLEKSEKTTKYFRALKPGDQ